MKRSTANIIVGIYDTTEENEPDISTERLLAMTADAASTLLGTEFDVGNVCDALELVGRTKEPNPEAR